MTTPIEPARWESSLPVNLAAAALDALAWLQLARDADFPAMLGARGVSAAGIAEGRKRLAKAVAYLEDMLQVALTAE